MWLTDYEKNPMLKIAQYFTFVACIAAGMVPLMGIYPMREAALITGATFSSLTLVAYNAPSKQFLNLGGPLSIALGLLCGASLLSSFVPFGTYPWLLNMKIYGGIATFAGFVLHDV